MVVLIAFSEAVGNEHASVETFALVMVQFGFFLQLVSVARKGSLIAANSVRLGCSLTKRALLWISPTS